ncbi:MAG: hypothetical protein R3A51_23515 [Nannocystaceae bacterium]|nr:hypothetical protein [Myxococcales bacterium]
MRRVSLLAFLSLTLGACGDSGGDTDATASGTNGTTGITLTGPTTDPSTTAGTSDPTTDGTETGSTSDATTDTGGTPCETKDDCPEETDKCEGGFCEFDPNFCGEAEVQNPVLVPPNVMLVLDKSGSMVNPDLFWDDDADDLNNDGFADSDPMMMTPATPRVSRWRSLHQVVVLIGNSFNGTMNLGAQLFPSTDAVAVLGPQACLVNNSPEVPIAPMNANAIIAGIPPEGDQSLAGGTPAEKGITSAVNHLLTVPNPNPDLPDPAPYIIFITDGLANCSTSAMEDAELLDYDQNLVPTVGAALSMGIPTYVVGVDIKDEVDMNGINPFQVLNEAANAGGVPKDDPVEQFYNTVNKAELEAALQAIIGEVLPCLIDLPDGVPPMTKPSLNVSGMDYPEPLPADADCDTEDGWRFTDDTMTQIELCGAACSGYQTLGQLELTFQCIIQG